MKGKGNLMRIGARVRSLNRNPFEPSLTVKLGHLHYSVKTATAIDLFLSQHGKVK